MQRQRGRSRPRAVVRFLVVLGFVLWIAHSLLVLHHKKQRTLVDRLVDRVHQDSDAGLKGAVPRTSALPSDEGGFDVDFGCMSAGFWPSFWESTEDGTYTVGANIGSALEGI